MADLSQIGKIVLLVGAALVLLGLLLLLLGRVPYLGRLPGDIVIRRGPVTIYAPIVTMLLLSLILTILLNLLFRR